MMYYVGTKEEIEMYNSLVSEQEGYNGVTQYWAKIHKHPTKDEYFILAHPFYEVPLSTVEKLPEEFYNM